MFKIKRESTLEDGNLFSAPEELKIVTINTVGAAGRGIALSARITYPKFYEVYRQRHVDKVLRHDEVWDIKLDTINLGLFPTKIHFRDASPPGLIKDNIPRLLELAISGGYKSIALPPIGMVNGWIRDDRVIADILICLGNTFKDSGIVVNLYAPDDLYTRMRSALGVK
jgi:hypothetical protein